MLKRRESAVLSGIYSSPGVACKISEKHPDLVEWLTAGTWPDGEARVPGTMLVFAEDGLWKCCLHDRAQSLSCFVSGKTLTECLGAAERACGEGQGEWRSKVAPRRGTK